MKCIVLYGLGFSVVIGFSVVQAFGLEGDGRSGCADNRSCCRTAPSCSPKPEKPKDFSRPHGPGR